MGILSCSISATELITGYGVKNLIRVGSCGAVSTGIKLLDVIIGMGASTDSKVNRIRFNGHDFAAIASYDLLRKAGTFGKPITGISYGAPVHKRVEVICELFPGKNRFKRLAFVYSWQVSQELDYVNNRKALGTVAHRPT